MALLAFSAKESVYKCLSSQFDGWIDFDSVEIDFALERGRFSATSVSVLDPECRRWIPRIAGAFAFRPSLTITAAVLSVADEGSAGPVDVADDLPRRGDPIP